MIMSNLLEKLHDDHRNFIKLLKYIELQLECVRDCEVVDFDTLLIALKYMKDYSDVIHHPLENIMFNYFLDSYDLNRDDITHLMNEHKEMPELTKKIIYMLECVISEMPIERNQFCEHLSKYIDIQKQHLNYEESKVYPCLSSNMKEHDWQAIDVGLNKPDDPLFDQPADKSYQLLLSRVAAAIK